jgi:hypothetical protein
MASAAKNETDLELARELFRRTATDLSMIVDHRVEIVDVKSERVRSRPAGKGSIHVSFKLEFKGERRGGHGCLLVPLAQAIRLAGYLLMLSEDEIKVRLERKTLEEDLKSGMFELASFIANAVDAALRNLGITGLAVRPEGCQGVRADVRPAFEYREGEELLSARASAQVQGGAGGEMVFLVPGAVLG